MRLFFLKAYSILAWITMIITSMIITPFFLLVWVCTFWWDKRRLAVHFVAIFWAWHYRSLIPFWKLHLEGRKKIPWNRAVVLVSNHRSMIDVPVLNKLRRPFKWTSKSENFKLPFVGMVLSLTNSVRIRRDSLHSGMQFLTQAESEMKKGSSILIFPEGTRSKTTTMRPFKEGAFLLAKKMESGIIPIVHTGSEKTFYRGSWVLRGKTHINIRVLDEIPAQIVKETDLKELTSMIRNKMEIGLASLDDENAGQ
ncbi:MAG: 1-acyl-sn-glycerol-3-phosphate acyltransferase [Bacteroidales bacterium]|nr:1-acyl-sn-glycerol-3-phosphate acyltransferase [Bacteroidales bacterium]